MLPARSRTDLIESYACLAYHQAKRVRHWSLDSADLVQCAMVAVIEAIDTFDPRRGVPLSAFVVERVKWALSGDIVRARRHSHNQGPRLKIDRNDNDDELSDLWDAIEDLPPHDQSVLIGFYGLDGRKRGRRELGLEHDQTVHQISESTTRSTKSLRAALTT